jgi:hypothetical protein
VLPGPNVSPNSPRHELHHLRLAHDELRAALDFLFSSGNRNDSVSRESSVHSMTSMNWLRMKSVIPIVALPGDPPLFECHTLSGSDGSVNRDKTDSPRSSRRARRQRGSNPEQLICAVDLTGRLRRPIGSHDEGENKSASSAGALVFALVMTPEPGEAGRSDRRREASLRGLRG